jgi:hypothetical protein
MKTKQRKSSSFRLPGDILARCIQESTARDMSQADFIAEALLEKFDRISSRKDPGWGALAGLNSEDRKRVMRFIECLRSDSVGFRRAVDANFAWLVETIK